MNTKIWTAFTIGLFSVVGADAQIGVSTVTPHSSFHVNGSVANKYQSFTNTLTATATDNLLVFTGTVSTTATLPSAAACRGRNYLIKNAGTGSPFPSLTLTPATGETIEGLDSWLLDEAGEAVSLVSDGIDWQVAHIYQPAQAASPGWNQNGNTAAAVKSLGTLSSLDLGFLTNNTEKMRLSAAGSLGIGSTVFDALNPEKLLVDAGTATSFNVISGKGTINSYLQLNIQNRSDGTSASSDLVASANNGSETANFIDIGINSSTFSNPAYAVLDGINNAYLYAAGNDLIAGNGTAGKNLLFFNGGTAAANEIIRVTGAGLTGIGNTTPTEKLQVEGNLRLSGLNRAIFFDASVDPYSGIKNISRSGEINELMLFSGNDVTGSFGADRIRLASNELHFATAPVSSSSNTGDPSGFYQNTANAPTRLFINQNGNVAIGTTAFNASKPEQLLVDAGNTSSYNVISARGSYNNYLQLNIQNNNGGASASSDIVATADNGNETSNFVNLGINGDGYTGSGITAGANNAYLFSTGNHLIIGNNTDNKNLLFYTSTAGTSTQRMRITSAGLLPGQDNVYALGSSSNRSSAIWAVNGTIQTSDLRLKKNIHALPYGLAAVMQLQPVAYNWIDEKDPGNKIGLLAQDVKKIIPEVVTGLEDRETLGMNYAELVPVLINALKELKQQEIVLRKKAAALHLLD